MEAFVESQNCSGLKGLLEIVESNQTLKQVPYSRLHRKASRGILNISRGDSTTPLDNLFQYSITVIVKKFFLMFI